MYKLIFADDEEIERKAFRLLLERNFPNVNLLTDVGNGNELVDKVVQLNPDIVIADINMPGLNGLEALKIIRNRGMKCRIIIYTAYSEFEYAKEALELGADDYILKPIKKDKIIDTIKKSINSLEIKRIEETSSIQLKKIVDDMLPFIESDIMSSMLLGDIDKDNLITYMDILGLKFKCGFIMTAYLPPDKIELLGSDKIIRNSKKKEILGIVKTEGKRICNCFVSSIINNKISLYIPIDNDLTQHHLKNWSIELAELLIQKVEEKFGFKLVIGIGRTYDNIEDLTRSYKESINVLTDKTIPGHIKHAGDIFTENTGSNPFNKYERVLQTLIANCDFQECCRIIDQAFIDMEASLELDIIKDLLLEFLSITQKFLMENNLLNLIDTNPVKSFLKEIIAINNTYELKNWVKSVVENMIGRMTETKKNKFNSFVKQAIGFINLNFNRDISLNETAESINVSSYYLSRLFKHELNKNFIDYLSELRINEAINLLKEKEYSIRELSERVGYNNPTYFCKVFKKYTGKTVGEFHNSISVSGT